MDSWRKQLKFDPLSALLFSGNEALQFFVRRDLLGEQVGPLDRLWRLPEAQKILKRQQADGSWLRPGEKKHAARLAASLLVSRFFQPDGYTSYQAATYWVRFEYPFWWNNLVVALDSISLIGLSKDDEGIGKALSWLVEHQDQDGLWKVSYAKPQEKDRETPKEREMKLWVSLAISRVFRRLYG